MTELIGILGLLGRAVSWRRGLGSTARAAKAASILRGRIKKCSRSSYGGRHPRRRLATPHHPTVVGMVESILTVGHVLRDWFVKVGMVAHMWRRRSKGRWRRG